MSRSPSEEALGTTSIMTQGGFEFYTVMERGMTFKPETPKEHWLEAVRKLCGMYEGATITRERALMMLADALNFGYDAYGEEFSQAIDGARSALGLTPKTIANAQWVYKSIEPYRRRDELTLAHYSVIAGFDANEQEQFIATALADPKHAMTVKELKEAVAEAHPKTKRGKDRTSKNGKNKPHEITNITEAKAAAVELSNFLTANEEKVKPGPLLDVMGHISKLYRRITDKGRKR